MGCGASTGAPPPDAKYAAADGPPQSPDGKGNAEALKRQYTAAIARKDDVDKLFDTFVSYEPSAAHLAEAVSAKLKTLGYRVPLKRTELDAQKEGIRQSRRVVILLAPAYFETAACCAEFCEAVKSGVEVLPVAVEGASWQGMPFPALTDVPATMETSEGLVRPRDAASAVFGHTIALDHKEAYLDAFLDKLAARLGPPASGGGAAATGTSAAGAAGAAPGERTIRFDAFLSHKRSEAQDIVARVHDKLTDLGYRAFIDRNDLIELPSLKLAVRDSAFLVVFLTPSYFASPWCCLEFVEAHQKGVPILFVHVDGAMWGDGARSFPALSDVPESILVEGVTVRPRDAAQHVFGAAPLVEHTRTYFGPFVDALTRKLGAPPSITAIEGDAKHAWAAAGGGATVTWASLRASLAKQSPAFNASAEGLIARALGVRNASDASAAVAAASFASMFAEASVAATVEALVAGASGQEAAEKCVPIIVDDDGDGGLALVGGGTTLADVRKQLIEANEDEDEEEEEEEENSALREVLASGQFTFSVKGRSVKRKQEKMIRGGEMGDPIHVLTKAAAAKADKAAAADKAEEEVAPGKVAASNAAAAAAAIVSQGQRRDADALSLDESLLDATATVSLRRHASLAAPATADRADATYLVAWHLAHLAEALRKGDAAAAATRADELRAYKANDAFGLLPKCAMPPPSAAPAAVLEALAADGEGLKEALLPALESMRREMYKAAAGTAIKQQPSGGAAAGGKKRHRVVILGGGPCGTSIAHDLAHGKGVDVAAFHVTLVDTKEYFEYTPNALRLMTDEKSLHGELFDKSLIAHADILKGSGELIVGAAAAIRKDHVLVGTASGVASRVVPYDYLVICTGTRYDSDIKTDGTSKLARKQAFLRENERIKAAPSVTVVGGGVVGSELAFDVKAFFPDKKVELATRSHAMLKRVPMADELVKKCADEDGITFHYKSEVVETNGRGCAVTKDGREIGEPGARVYWATGYRPNNAFILDGRTDRTIADCLDDKGYLKTKRSHQLDHPELGHIFAGGDICWSKAFTVGERTFSQGGAHAFAISKNIQVLAGVREGKLKRPNNNRTPGIEAIGVSLGSKRGFFFGTDPMAEGYFATKETLLAERGPLADAGPSGWIEINPGMDYLKFSFIPDLLKQWYVDDNESMLEAAYGPDGSYKVVDLDD